MTEIRTHQPRQPRIQILPLHRINFLPKDGSKPIQVSNISGSGIGLIKSSDTNYSKGDAIEGTLKTADQEIELTLNVMQETTKVLGCQISNADTEKVELVIETYFQLELAALNVKKVAVESRQDAPKQPASSAGQPYWFLGENNCELYFLEKEGHVDYFNLSFFGNYIEGSQNSSLAVGTIINEKEDTVAPQEHFSASVFDAAKTFVANIKDLDATHRDEIIEMIEKG